MSIFKRRDKDEEYDEDEEEELEEKGPRKIKDLKPQNRKKRKEPLKPWGRKERLLIFSIFTASILIAIFLALFGRGWKKPTFGKIDFSFLNFFKEETITIGTPKKN